MPEFTVNGSELVLRGVPYRKNDDYVFAKLEVHFGNKTHLGSEHSLDGKKSHGEVNMRFVF